MRLPSAIAFVILAATACCGDEPPSPIATILEDNAAELLPKLTNPTGDPGEGHLDEKEVFSGKSSIRIVPMQRFNNFIPGWNYLIREKPKPGEYRYLRFAWKAPGLSGVMLQLHDTDWHIRYTAGADKFGWGTKYVADKPPSEWKVTTVDLWKDFGDRDLHGIALTCFDGEAAWFDHIYFGRTIEELDRIDATGIGREAAEAMTQEELDLHWRQLESSDDATSYRSFWQLVAAGDVARGFVTKKLGRMPVVADAAQLAKWLAQLDDDDFEVREAATKELQENLPKAAELIEAALKKEPSAEARFRLESILKKPAAPLTQEDRQQQRAEKIVARIAERKAAAERAGTEKNSPAER